MSVRRYQGVGVAVLTGGLMLSGLSACAQNSPAQNGSTLPDAQIESNVLRALASAPQLSSQNIQSSTVYGTVTLTGNVHDEAMRTTAENLVARAQGVQKVVDELALGDTPPAAAGDQGAPPQNGQQDGSENSQMVLQSDGTYAPAQGQNGASSQDAQQMQDQNGAPPPPNGGQGEQGAPQGRQPMNQNYGPPANGAPIPGGQQAGIPVTIPPGSMLRIRINRGLDSNHIQIGAGFDGTVLTDIIADGEVAIPRGASVSGVVIGAKKAGAFKGEGQLSLQVNSLTLGGQQYPLNTEVWAENGRDKTGRTVPALEPEWV
jgi:hypothetical protein